MRSFRPPAIFSNQPRQITLVTLGGFARAICYPAASYRRVNFDAAAPMNAKRLKPRRWRSRIKHKIKVDRQKIPAGAPNGVTSQKVRKGTSGRQADGQHAQSSSK
jgi:hypothetical protein